MDNRFILLSGMGWSGSSAIIDILVQNNLVSGINNYYPNETAFFNTFFSPFELIKNSRSFETISMKKILCVLTGGKIYREFINNELFKILTKINPEINSINEFPTDGVGRNKDNFFNNDQINWFTVNFEKYIKFWKK